MIAPRNLFPLPVLNGQSPVVLVFDPDDHRVKIAYERHPHEGSLVRSATRESTLYVIPELTPVFAVADGKIVYASKHSDGHAVLVEHRDGWSSYYSRLEHMFATPSERRPPAAQVRCGDLLGYASSGQVLQPLRFELWRYGRDEEYEAIGFIRDLHRWHLCPWECAAIRNA